MRIHHAAYGTVQYGTVPYRKQLGGIKKYNRKVYGIEGFSWRTRKKVPFIKPLSIKKKGTLPSDMTRKLVANKEKRYVTIGYDQKTRGE